ncbi:serine--tRNA ligase [Bosea sp. ANAM02]|uniref:serine--tRNA ligase n=1 Tax=Bosea sp. ANAM02 TaxID=2020412 RepID=UPI0015665788|nr:serine--tRNA ligase [Bosea sp. ANAM02]
MYDIRWIRANAYAFDRSLMRRGLAPLSSSLLELDDARRSSIGKAEQARERRNALSGEIGRAMAAKDLDLAEKLKAEVAELKKQQPQLEAEEKAAKDVLDEKLAAIPNMPFDDVPDGDDEKDNVVRHVHGVRPEERGLLVGVVDPKQHFELGEALGQMDFERAAKLSGSRFVLLQSQIARLSRAIGQFMLDTHTEEHGFTEVNPPLLVRDNAMFGTAQLPKFRDDQFRAGDDHWLIPTAEVPLTNLVRDAILDEEELPLRFTALTPCFRAEAGSAGRDVRGMLRQHQFEKVELVSITAPEKAREEHERMLAGAEAVLKKLDLHYRVMTLCSGDMGFASQMTFDVEVWMPGQRAYREISSVSVCGEFQARRMNARYRPAEGGVPRFVHTLNGSGTAVGRALIAVMENYQNADGSITVPEVLVPYMRGLTRIEKAV